MAELVGATLKTESTILEGREVLEDVALCKGRRSRSNITVLSETKRVGTVQLVGSNTSVEARRSKRLLQDARETTTLRTSERNRRGREVGRRIERRRPKRKREKSDPNGRSKGQSWVVDHHLMKCVGDPRQNGSPGMADAR